jgi:hypothetical protein
MPLVYAPYREEIIPRAPTRNLRRHPHDQAHFLHRPERPSWSCPASPSRPPRSVRASTRPPVAPTPGAPGSVAMSVRMARRSPPIASPRVRGRPARKRPPPPLRLPAAPAKAPPPAAAAPAKGSGRLLRLRHLLSPPGTGCSGKVPAAPAQAPAAPVKVPAAPAPAAPAQGSRRPGKSAHHNTGYGARHSGTYQELIPQPGFRPT